MREKKRKSSTASKIKIKKPGSRRQGSNPGIVFNISKETAARLKTPGPRFQIKEGASFDIRLLARLLDTGIRYILTLFVGIWIGPLIRMWGESGKSYQDMIAVLKRFNLFSWVLIFAAILIYHTLMEGVCGASIGKLFCGLRVVTLNGRPCNLEKAFQRNLAMYWDGLFLGLVGYNSMQKTNLRQRYGDVWAETVVVKAAEVPLEFRRSFRVFVSAFLMGMGFYFFITMTSVLVKLFG